MIPSKNLFSSTFFPKSYGELVDKNKEIVRPEYNYVWNSIGLRSIEFSEKPEVIAIGCSMTLGTGLPLEATWPMLLQEKICSTLGYRVGNLSYNGASIMKVISYLFSLIKVYDYTPKYIICNFPSLERFRFIDEDNKSIRDYFSNSTLIKKTSIKAPFRYDEFLPFEWVHYINLEYIKMLEVFCKQSGINLIWSTWSQIDKKYRDDIFENNFEFYKKDPTRECFPATFEQVGHTTEISKVAELYKIIDKQCHDEYHNLDYFDYAYDLGTNKDLQFNIEPHPGLHRQIHWAEFYYDEMIKTMMV